MNYFYGNTVAHGGAPKDEDLIYVCPHCKVIDSCFTMKKGVTVCKSCWQNVPENDFLQPRKEYLGIMDYKDY